jgi:hypothetical protein
MIVVLMDIHDYLLMETPKIVRRSNSIVLQLRVVANCLQTDRAGTVVIKNMEPHHYIPAIDSGLCLTACRVKNPNSS